MHLRMQTLRLVSMCLRKSVDDEAQLEISKIISLQVAWCGGSGRVVLLVCVCVFGVV